MEYLFESKHLRFRRFELSDAVKLYENHLEDEMTQWIPNESYEDIPEAQGAINFHMDCVNKRQLPYVLAIELKENGLLIRWITQKIPKSGKILDLGCGPGLYASILAKKGSFQKLNVMMEKVSNTLEA